MEAIECQCPLLTHSELEDSYHGPLRRLRLSRSANAYCIYLDHRHSTLSRADDYKHMKNKCQISGGHIGLTASVLIALVMF